MKFQLGLGAALLAINSVVVAQSVVYPPLIYPIVPRFHGQWAGPYELNVDDNGLYAAKWTQEIAHALVLPPETTGTGTLADDERVLFSCVTGGGCWPDGTAKQCTPNATDQKYGRTYRWRPNRTSDVVPVQPPAGIPNFPSVLAGSQDFFCGGHTFLPNGDVLWIGGTDKLAGCAYQCPGGPLDPPFFGHVYAYRLNTRAEPPTWSSAGTMAYARWYAAATELANGHILATGHAGGGALASNYDLYREDYDPSQPAASAWSTPTFNEQYVASCASGADVHIEDYPRLHLLMSGEIVQTNASYRTTPTGIFPLLNAPTRYLDVFTPSCAVSPVNRWHDGHFPSVLHLDAPSVQLITWVGAVGQQGQFKEVVYLIGGSTKGIEGSCAWCLEAPSVFLATVEKLTNPSSFTNPAWEPVSPLNYSRTNCNAVILLDGSILVIGGLATVPSGSTTHCISRRNPEMYKPPEVFGTAGGGNWQVMAQQSVPRRYHSVAGLLSDGRVFSAGGHNPVGYQVPPYDVCNPPPPPPVIGCPAEECPANNPFLDDNADVPDHSAEIYSPPYFFQDGSRPSIDKSTLSNPITNPYTYGAFINMDVTMSAILDRVAILKNASDTHGFDFDQRYVELPIDADVVDASDSTKHHIRVKVPPDGFYAPPGYYLLTVVDALQRPSEAEWVRITSP